MAFIERRQERSLGELLLQSGLIKKDELSRALQEQQRSAEPLGKIMIRMGFISEQDVLQALHGLLVVIFHLGKEDFAFEALFVREIIRWREVNKLPSMPQFVAGILQHREAIIPIVNLSRRLGLPSGPVNDDTRIIVVESASQIYGLVVDSVESVMQLPMEHIESNPGSLQRINPRYIYGVGKTEKRLITLLQLTNIMVEITWPADPGKAAEMS